MTIPIRWHAFRPHQKALLAAGTGSLVLLVLPVASQLMLPLRYLATHVHELCHAVTAVAVGGHVERIEVYANGNGLTPVETPGGLSMLLVASAGYVGASLVGAAMIYFGRSPRGARCVLYALAGSLTASLALWVRGDIVGVVSGFLWVVALDALAFFLRGQALLFAAQFLGIQQCLNAALSLLALLQWSAYTNGHSDAMIMEAATGIPAIAWALAWFLFSLILIGGTLEKVWNARPTSPA